MLEAESAPSSDVAPEGLILRGPGARLQNCRAGNSVGEIVNQVPEESAKSFATIPPRGGGEIH